MLINDDKLRVDAVTRYEQEEQAKREAVRFVIAVLVGSFVFAVLVVWYFSK